MDGQADRDSDGQGWPQADRLVSRSSNGRRTRRFDSMSGCNWIPGWAVLEFLYSGSQSMVFSRVERRRGRGKSGTWAADKRRSGSRRVVCFFCRETSVQFGFRSFRCTNIRKKKATQGRARRSGKKAHSSSRGGTGGSWWQLLVQGRKSKGRATAIRGLGE